VPRFLLSVALLQLIIFLQTAVSQSMISFITAIGHRNTIIIGFADPVCNVALKGLMLILRHDWGGYVAIAAANMYPSIVRRIAVLCVPHMRAFTLLPLMQLLRSWY
jgi:pimeloyl-ACP methyl ester carboxylesterase